MTPIVKYLIFVGILAATSFAALNFDIDPVSWSRTGKILYRQQGFRVPHITKKPTSLLSDLPGPAVIDFNPPHNLTAAAAEGVVMVWCLPDTVPLHELDSGEGFQALSLCFIPLTSLVAAGGKNIDNTGGVRFFDAATGEQRLWIDEPEPILALDPHPGGRYLLVTGETYIKVLDMKDGNTLAVLQKNSPASRGYYYGDGKYVLQSDSLSLFDLNKRSITGALDSVKPLLFKKGLSGGTFAWLSAQGVTVVTAASGKKAFYPLDTRGVTAFDIEPNGTWGLFLKDSQKVAVIDLTGKKIIKTIGLKSPALNVTINADCSNAYVQYVSGAIAVFDIGYRARMRNMQSRVAKLVDGIKSKLEKTAQPEPK